MDSGIVAVVTCSDPRCHHAALPTAARLASRCPCGRLGRLYAVPAGEVNVAGVAALKPTQSGDGDDE